MFIWKIEITLLSLDFVSSITCSHQLFEINTDKLISENHSSCWDHSTPDALDTISTGIDRHQNLSFSFQTNCSSYFKTRLYVCCSVFYIFLINMPGRLMVTSEIKPWCRHFDFYSSSLRVTQTVVTDCSEWLINQTLFIDRLYILPHN